MFLCALSAFVVQLEKKDPLNHEDTKYTKWHEGSLIIYYSNIHRLLAVHFQIIKFSNSHQVVFLQSKDTQQSKTLQLLQE